MGKVKKGEVYENAEGRVEVTGVKSGGWASCNKHTPDSEKPKKEVHTTEELSKMKKIKG